jgi:hypothetical protein
LREDKDSADWIARVDVFLSGMSWDKTVLEMSTLITEGIRHVKAVKPENMTYYV